ncbi:hypothetical protein SRO_5715 [Streptomyces rochei]|nr:hypothetical protein SRO_5715 [Streptomyces rochei]
MRGTGGSLGMRAGPVGWLPADEPQGSGLMKKTTGVLWWGSRMAEHRFESTVTADHPECGIGHSSSTLRWVRLLERVKWVTGSRRTGAKNQ